MGLAVLALTLVLVSAFELPLHSALHEFPLQVEDALDRLMTIEAATSNNVPLESERLFNAPLLMDFYLITEIGTPKNGTARQTFTLAIETRGESIVVIAVDCVGKCPTGRYDPKASASSEVLMERKTDSTMVIYAASDNVTVSGLTADKLHFVVLKPLTDPMWTGHEDGYFGLAPSYRDAEESFMRMLAFNKKIDKASFAVFLHQNKSKESVISFGENNLKYTLDTALTMIDCDSQTSNVWVIFADVSFDGTQLTTYPTRTDIKIEVMSILVPFSIYASIQQSICPKGTQCTTKNSFTQFKCSEKDTFPDFTITVKGVSMTISDQFYIQRSNGFCWLLISPINNDYIVLGQPFFYAYYLEFNSEQYKIGFARSINTVEREKPVSIWVWVVVCVGVVAFLMVVGIIICCILKRRKVEREEEESLVKVGPRTCRLAGRQ